MMTANQVAIRDALSAPPPVAVGGVGGSGTRLVAQILHALGCYIGDHHAQTFDLLWFTLLFRRIEAIDTNDQEFDLLTRVLVSGLVGASPLDSRALRRLQELSATPRPNLPAERLRAIAESLATAAARHTPARFWGWKEPNTHVVIERLWKRLPQLRYVHVVRNGVDMAYSKNQNQLCLWGPRVLGEDGPITPGRSLAYWCRVHQRMQRLLADNPQRMYWLDYDELCREPLVETGKLCRFLGCDQAPATAVLGHIRTPLKREGIDLGDFGPDDLEYVHSLGYFPG